MGLSTAFLAVASGQQRKEGARGSSVYFDSVEKIYRRGVGHVRRESTATAYPSVSELIQSRYALKPPIIGVTIISGTS